MATKPCPRIIEVKEAWEDDILCGLPKMPGKNACLWHWLMSQPIEIQIERADRRRRSAESADGYFPRARVPEAQWPAGERWCSGCQGFVPRFYTTGSRCMAHASQAAHGSRLEAVYELLDNGVRRPFTEADYQALYDAQGGRCYVCRRRSNSRRLAVDHDHGSGLVRGLLCPDPERGCNKAVLGNIEAHAQDSALAAAKRIVEYLEAPPATKLWPAAPVLPEWAR